MEITGKVRTIFDAQEISPTFRKREIVITTQEQYPQNIIIEFVQDKTEILNQFNEGQLVKIGINLRGREWKAPDGTLKFFNSIQGWRIEPIQEQPGGQAAPQQQAAPVQSAAGSTPPGNFTPMSDSDNGPEEADDLPF